mmetsp:Transcript_103067/g.204616  ORF Transcript_103067/g.204616 Transcript_103067/m.204616 type:complete len:249 (+) Transcript_103067:607-1353(+)
MKDMCCRREVVDDYFHGHRFIDGDERHTLSATLTLGVEQRCVRLLPWPPLSEHVHAVTVSVWCYSCFEFRPDYPHIKHVSDIWLLRLLRLFQVAHHTPSALEICVPLQAGDWFRRGTSASALWRCVATQEIVGRAPWVLIMSFVVEECPEIAGVHPWHMRRRCMLEKASEVVGCRHDVVARLLVSTNNYVSTFACMQVELLNLFRLHVGTVHGNECHVMTCNLNLKVLGLAHHANEAESVTLPLLNSN